MNVVVSLNHRFARTPDGVVRSRFFMYSFWTRYLEVFDTVRVVARVDDVMSTPPYWQPSSGDRVSFHALPPYRGTMGYLANLPQLRRCYRSAIGPEDAVILRVPSVPSTGLEAVVRRSARPYGVEVVGDPYDNFSPGAVNHPLRPFFRWLTPRQMGRQCAGAEAAAYVTEYTLQRRYPARSGAFVTHYSSIELSDDWLRDEPRPVDRNQRSFRLITVGTLDQLYKAPDVLIDAVAVCLRGGLDLVADIVGEGRYQRQLQDRASALGISNRVCFVGQVPSGYGVRERLDYADLFVLPSRQEGLPRVIIEAMARGLPCVGSTVGGIPELLPAEDLVPPNDALALAKRIREVITDPVARARMAARNIAKARQFRESLLRERRTAFYRYLREQTERWRNARVSA